MDTVYFSKTMASTDKSALRQNPEEQDHQIPLSLILETRRLSLDLFVNEILVLYLLLITYNNFVWYIYIQFVCVSSLLRSNPPPKQGLHS
jgi:hypothetical protein